MVARIGGGRDSKPVSSGVCLGQRESQNKMVGRLNCVSGSAAKYSFEMGEVMVATKERRGMFAVTTELKDSAGFPACGQLRKRRGELKAQV